MTAEKAISKQTDGQSNPLPSTQAAGKKANRKPDPEVCRAKFEERRAKRLAKQVRENGTPRVVDPATPSAPKARWSKEQKKVRGKGDSKRNNRATRIGTVPESPASETSVSQVAGSSSSVEPTDAHVVTIGTVSLPIRKDISLPFVVAPADELKVSPEPEQVTKPALAHVEKAKTRKPRKGKKVQPVQKETETPTPVHWKKALLARSSAETADNIQPREEETTPPTPVKQKTPKGKKAKQVVVQETIPEPLRTEWFYTGARRRVRKGRVVVFDHYVLAPASRDVGKPLAADKSGPVRRLVTVYRMYGQYCKILSIMDPAGQWIEGMAQHLAKDLHIDDLRYYVAFRFWMRITGRLAHTGLLSRTLYEEIQHTFSEYLRLSDAAECLVLNAVQCIEAHCNQKPLRMVELFATMPMFMTYSLSVNCGQFSVQRGASLPHGWRQGAFLRVVHDLQDPAKRSYVMDVIPEDLPPIPVEKLERHPFACLGPLLSLKRLGRITNTTIPPSLWSDLPNREYLERRVEVSFEETDDW